jgi:hypothetical protein
MEARIAMAARSSCVVGLAVFVAFAYQPLCHAADRCRGAENEIARLRTWADLEGWYRRFPRCDDGCAAEALDRRIVDMLVKEWENLPQLQELSNQQPQLKRFVLRHIDGESDPKTLRRLRTEARKSCPAGLEAFCREIGTAVSHALAEQAEAEAAAKR